MSCVHTSVLTVIDRQKLRISAFAVSPGKASVLRKLIDKIGENNLKIVCTGGNFSYGEELYMNAEIKQVVSKSETCLVESYDSVLRCYLARLHRKTKCYSKSIQMLELSIALLIHSRKLFLLICWSITAKIICCRDCRSDILYG